VHGPWELRPVETAWKRGDLGQVEGGSEEVAQLQSRLRNKEAGVCPHKAMM